MKFVYGKQDFKTLERGQENCYLLTNGLGGFSSVTVIGSAARNDHAFFMACTKAPNHRYHMIHRLRERLVTAEDTVYLSSQEFADGKEPEDGYLRLSSFQFEDCPVWMYHTAGVEVRKTAAMKQGENTIAVQYEIQNHRREACTLQVVPFLQFVKKGDDLDMDQAFSCSDGRVSSAGLDLYFSTDGIVTGFEPVYETYYYAYDACDGRRETGKALANHGVSLTAGAGVCSSLEIVYSLEPVTETAEAILEGAVRYRRELERQAGFQSEAASMLAKSAAQFIARRESTGGDTILAGYPFFEDWGRDTMIALGGCALATGRFETVKSILRTFLKAEKNGLMPNLFPEGGSEPMYNTVDAALLFINSVYLYYERTNDISFVRECYPVMEHIVKRYEEGTEFGIHMEEDGLIAAGKGFDQVTWMDVRIGGILPTPRHGKPVEINAYWYNALRIMERLGGTASAARYGRLAELVKQSFNEKFWLEEKHCLKDVISGREDGGRADADNQIRCNQIWAVSMAFSMLSPEKEKQVVETVAEKLYTPYGLRTLSEDDKEFRPFYGGSQLDRDLAYHQGTVWVFPLGGYYLAYLKVHGYSREAKAEVCRQLEVLEGAMREGCAGQLPEIYDGKNPVSSKGCFAQAWSVGEILRVYEALEKV